MVPRRLLLVLLDQALLLVRMPLLLVRMHCCRILSMLTNSRSLATDTW
jgi:hypothetical protein